MLLLFVAVESGDFNPDQNDDVDPSYVAAAAAVVATAAVIAVFVLLVPPPPPITVSVVEGGRCSDEDVNLV